MAQTIVTFAGNGTMGYTGDGGAATSAQIFSAPSICSDKAGNIYFADHGNRVVRRISPSGIITTFAGNGTAGYSGDGGLAVNAQFGYPRGVCSDQNGNIYITDVDGRIRKVNAAGIITTIAGNGIFASTGDGGLATSASLASPCGMATDAVGNLYVAESAGYRVRKIDVNGIITTVVGNATTMDPYGDGGLAVDARLQSPVDVAIDNQGNLYIADVGHSRIRKVDKNGIITTLAGNSTTGYSGDSGPATAASLNNPSGVAVDNFGNVLIADTRNAVIRKVSSNGIITTVAGTGTHGYSGDGGSALKAQLDNPTSVELDAAGNLYIGCSGFRIRKIGDVVSCSNNFLKAYRKEEGTASLKALVVTPDNNIIVGGYITNPDNSADYTNSFLMKLTNKGDKIWEKPIELDGYQWIDHIIPLKDRNYLAFGVDKFNLTDAIFLMKFDVDGNIIWRRTWKYNFGVNLSIHQISEDVDGSLIAVGVHIEDGLSFHDRFLFLKFDATGTLQLSKSFAPPGPLNTDAATDLIIKDGFSYVTGLYHNYYHLQGALLKINNSNGNLVWNKYYSFDGGDVRFSQIFPFGTNQLVMIGVDNLNSTKTSVLVRTDLNGTVLSAKYIKNPNYKDPGRAIMDATGNLIWFNRNYDPLNSEYDISVTKLHPQNGIEWAKEYQQLTSAPFVNNVAFGTDSSIYFVGGTVRPPVDVNGFVGRLSRNGNLSCPALALPTDFGDANSSATDFLLTATDKTFTETSRNGNDVAAQINFIDTLCYGASTCSLLSLAAATHVCQNDTVFLSVNKTCSTLPDFSYNTRLLQLVAQSDTLLKFKAIGKGLASIKGAIVSDCQVLEDSVHILINAAMSGADLGPDTTICEGNIITLNVHTGYASYQWQDGSTDSTFIVKQPGLYFVSVTDACSRIYNDTVVVIAAPRIPFDVGPDRTKCNNDTLHLSAPAGFINYSWSNNYKINSTTAQNVIVNPLTDTAYYVKVEKTPGCFAYDTVRIKVNTSAPISLGTDKSFCSGDSAVFDAGGGFNQYVWNNASNSQQISVTTAGTFSVIGITAQGCRSYDTVKVNVFSNPVVSLDQSNYLCTGTSRILDAGGHSSYLWNDGSTSQKIIAKNVGIYAVQVTDNNGCKGSDTTEITSFLPLPSDFLPNDTLLCSYDKLSIKPIQAYKTYQWSTGASAASLIVSQPGTYWLQVKDAKCCVGRDTMIIVAKDCMKGCYVPTAFSPNKDGKNDLFRPMLFGRTKKFQFIVYNRWGQVVFQTTELNRAWDGKVAGVEQDANVFVWVCNYQFEGEEEKTEKGTVMLVR